MLRGATLKELRHCQEAFDDWLGVYNLERPHQALGMTTPASRYHVSQRKFPEQLPPVEYGPEDQARRVQDQGRFTWKGRNVKVGNAFKGLSVAVRPTSTDGLWEVFFMASGTSRLCLNVSTMSPNTCPPRVRSIQGADYPHTESTFPRSRQIIEEILLDCTEEEKAKIVGGNAARVYNL